MFFKLLLVFLTCAIIVIHCEDCFIDITYGEKRFQFDLTSFKQLLTVNFTKSNDVYSLNIKLCTSNNEHKLFCNGTIGSHVCLVKNKKYVTDIGSKLKEMKLNSKDQLFMTFEGNSSCTESNKKYTTDIIFICNKSIIKKNIYYKQDLDRCKHTIEFTSIDACPVDDLDTRKKCEVTVLHNFHKFNLKPLRQSNNNYVVKNQNHHFEVNICGRLVSSNNCGGNITTVCDMTNISHPNIYAVGYSKNDDLKFDFKSRNLKLIQHERTSKRSRGRRIEFDFKCNENIPPEKTKLEFLYENHKGNNNVAYFEVATSTVCIPRMTLCEIFISNTHFNLKPLHKRVGNWIVPNVNTGGRFYLNVCGYINQYDKGIPISCTVDGKTSACYVDKLGKGFPVGSTQIGPSYEGNSILLNYTDGINCTNNLLWSTLINFICSHKSQIIHDSTNFTSCTHVFQWQSPEACKKIFDRNDQCLVTQPDDSSRVYNMTDLKYQTFKIIDENKNVQFWFSICSPLQTPCNGYLDAAACWFVNESEINIGIFTEQIVFDNGKIYMSMEGEKCVDDGPNSLTTIRFVCDYFDSKSVNLKKDLIDCTFEFVLYTKNACTRPLAINCSVTDDLSGNIFDLSQLTKFDSNYGISISPKKTIVLNVCHTIINNDINAINCQFKSGVCLIDNNSLLISDRYINLGDVNKGPYMKKNKIFLEMVDGFYNGHTVSSIIEFTCSDNTNGPVFKNEENGIYRFKWFTPLVCSNNSDKNNKTHIVSSNITVVDHYLTSTTTKDISTADEGIFGVSFYLDHLTSTTTKDNLTRDEGVLNISFYLGIPVVLIMLSALWFYRWQLLREVRRIFNHPQWVRRRHLVRHDYL